MSQQLEELAVLREQTDVLVQQTISAQQRLQPVHGTDTSGEITVHIDAHGSISSVKVGFAWDQKLRKEDLAPAVMEALATASFLRMETYANAVSEVENEPAPRARPAATPPTITEMSDRFTHAPDEADAAERFVENVLAEAIEGLDEANRILAEHASMVHTGRSGPGHVRASVNSSGSLQGLDIDRVWLSSAHPANLGREITEAITQAAHRARQGGLTSALRASKLAQVAAEVVGFDQHSTPRED